MKTTKKLLAFMLSALMIFSVAIVPGADLSMFAVEADAAITLGGITQQRVVSNYESIYRSYQERFFMGAESNEPTNFVIPGLSSSNDYTPQGMTYWEEKEWILISAYDASGSGKHSVIYALDAVTTDFVALFKILNADGSVNTSHGGGIAASKYNFYYADTGSNISYIPLSEMDVAKGTVKEIKLRGSINCSGELGGAATSYCCYEDGVLWAGNFYYNEDDRYATSAHSAANSMIVGYELHGNSSAEEWYYLSTNYNVINLNIDSSTQQTWTNNSGVSMNFTTMNTNGANVEIRGTITNTTGNTFGEVTQNFCSFKLTEGVKYKLEFITDNYQMSDLYMFAPNGTHCDVKLAQSTTITDLGNGKYHYQMIFTAGLKPNGADSSWPTTQSTNGSYTGTYTMRFDQDSVAAGERKFNMTDISISKFAEASGFTPDSNYEGVGCAGNPTYVILFPGIDKIQYAMVFKGKIYISRSWKRTSGTNHTRELMIGDIDIYSPGAESYSINGRTRPCTVLNVNNMTRFGGDNGASNLNQMFYMGEALCVIEDYLYMFGEGAAWAYNGKESNNKCDEPIDVIWKIDQHFLLDEKRLIEDTKAIYYEKVTDISGINSEDEYIIVHKSPEKDPITQKNILYAIDAFGGYGGHKLPKQDAGSQPNTGDSMGIVGYPITNYSIDEENENIIYLSEEDASKLSIRWEIEPSNATHDKAQVKITNKDLYYSTNEYLYFGSRLFAMTTTARKNLDRIYLEEFAASEGNFVLYYLGGTTEEAKPYYLWCNDGRDQDFIAAYTEYYSNHGKTGYVPKYHGLEEVPGTFHSDAFHYQTDQNTGTLIGSVTDVEMGSISIYKRVNDEYSTTSGSRVYTDMFAELQADGTYTIDIESYAISNLQYQKVNERPTDFIFVLDASGSMTNNTDARGYHTEINNWSALKMKQAANSNDISENGNYNREWTSNFYYKLPDGEFARISVAVNKGSDGTYSRDIWLWCKHPVTGRCYKISQNGYLVVNNCTGNPSTDSSSRLTEAMYLANPSAYGYASSSEILAEASSDKNRTDYHSSRNSQDKRRDYEVLNYKYTDGYGFTRATYYSYGECYRLLAMQQAVEKLTYKIENEVKNTGLQHRIAIVQFGSDGNESYSNTGMYKNTSTAMVQYSKENPISATNYQNAFFTSSQFATVRSIINNIKTWDRDHDTYSNFGFEMANNIVKNSDADYLADGNRSACIIMITDGVPGLGNNNPSSAISTANAAIDMSHQSKESGAYVYSVLMGSDSCSGFSMDNYMDYVSSEFIDSTSLSSSGDRNVADIDYRINVPTGSTFNITNLVNDMFNSITKNSTNAMVRLTADSVLREHVTDAFDISNATIEAYTADCEYDGIGRLGFAQETLDSSITVLTDELDVNIVKSTGFDYTEKYISKNHPGKKLIIRLTGVEANENAELLNTSINEHDTTAIYENISNMTANKPFKKFPTESFTIPEYTYVLDYGINMYDSDINGTLVSVDSEPRKQNSYSTVLDTDNIGITFTNAQQDMLYSLKPQSDGAEEDSRGYCLIQRDNGTYDWFRINILPASNVYFEEFTGTKQTTTENANYANWHQDGTKESFTQNLTNENDVYGFDKEYSKSTSAFSYGSAYKAEVNSDIIRSETISFSYTGTAVDIVASCGSKTGIYIVTIKNSNGVEKAYIVDTYFTDNGYLSSTNQLNQVPIVHHENSGGYDTYTVEVTSVYLAYIVGGRSSTYALDRFGNENVSFFSTDISDEAKEAVLSFADMDYLLDENVEVIFCDENSIFNGGTGAEGTNGGMSTFALGSSSTETSTGLVNYFDGYRIYNPLGDNEGEYPQSEQGSVYYNIINSLATPDSILNGTSDKFVGYIVGSGSTNEISFSDYESKGPANEVYLTKGNAIAFTAPEGYERVMVSLRAVNGATKAKIGSKEFTVSSTTEMYYDITPYIEDNTVAILNSGSGILAVNNIKLVSGHVVEPMAVFNMSRIRMMMAAPATEVEPNVPEETTNENISWPEVDPVPEGTAPEDDGVEDNVSEDTDSTDGIIDTLKSVLNKIIAFFNKVFTLLKSLAA